MAEILSDFLVETAQGYYCSYGDFFIDPSLPVEKAVISHAHGDHARPGHRYIYATAATIAFMQERFSSQPVHTYESIPYHVPLFFGPVEVTFIPAGHILGSAQILMKYQHVSYLYTGDIKNQFDPTCEPLEVVEADVLITETTFADPAVIHPDPVEEIKKLSATAHPIMLGCYGLGKAQRITYLINQYCPEKTIFVHHSILRMHRVYDRLGLVPLRYEVYQRKVMRDGQHKIYMVPPITFNNYFRAKNVLRAFASGWKRLQQHNDIELYISDHVDWMDILQLIDGVKPREIWTVHGNGHLLVKHLQGQVVRELQKMM
ncbi:exonuclease [Sphingobacterium sp. SGG-5]|uniref:MBL fold metallo-hydrolase n=1 Tax=Sphingobacterium sp. SGG-5 TaxID=2710881 RepID=UPI0013ECC776|nr:MBL fold metallo-hydrolase [Sphingobacterium sp. SGG-5]NGM62271.1 exonuclease [Sphingobacterium sp. SGG-5]